MGEKKIAMCLWSTKVCTHRLDFQSKNYSYAIFIVKNRPLYVNFSTPPCGNWFFSLCSTPPVGMNFWGHVPNSPINRNPKRLIPYLLQKMVFLGSETLLYPSGIGKKYFFFNFECYDLTNGKEWSFEIWWASIHTSQLQDSTVRSTKRFPKFAKSTLLWIGADLRQFWWKIPLEL
jgi:hypothetical protein